MRILHIIDSLGLGGAQTVVKGIFESQKNNKDIFLFALRKRELKIEVNHPNVNLVNSNSKYSLAPLQELRSLIEKEKIDILHCHLFRSQVFGWILKRFYFPNIKLIFHEHGEIFEKHFIYNSFMKKSRNLVDKYIAVSKATEKRLIDFASIKKEKINVIYNFVDLDRFNRKNIKINLQKEKNRLGINKEEFVIGFAGRIIKRKGWEEFIEAAKILSKTNNFLRYIIGGEGKDKRYMLSLIKRYGLQNKVIYLGYVKDMTLFYCLSDVFVIPSHWEPMGLTELEAQSIGVPVIATNVDGLNEVIKDYNGGLLVKPKDKKGLAKKINLMHSNKELRVKLISNGLKNVKNYSLANYIPKLNGLYERF